MKTIGFAKGFSLIEMLVAMVAGLIVLGAVVVFTAATAQSSSANIRSSRVMLNLRSSMNLIEREIRRSGFDENAIKFAGTCTSTGSTCPIGNFNRIVIATSSCIISSYDVAAEPTAGTPDAGEYHAFRLVQKSNVGVIQANLLNGTAPSCSDAANASGWQDVTDPTIINVTNLAFTQQTAFGGCVQQKNTGLWLVVQDVLVQMSGQWVDPSSRTVSARSIEDSIRVKNDVVSLTKPSVCP